MSTVRRISEDEYELVFDRNENKQIKKVILDWGDLLACHQFVEIDRELMKEELFGKNEDRIKTLEEIEEKGV